MKAPWDNYELALSPRLRANSALNLPHDKQSPVHPVLIVGAGLAGCWLARLLAERGIRVCVLEQHQRVAAGASGNPAGMLKPHVSRTANQAMHFYLEAHGYLQRALHARPELLDTKSGENGQPAMGVLQLIRRTFPSSDHYRNLTPDQTTKALGLALNSHALLFEQAGWINPNALCKALMQHPNIQLKNNSQVRHITSFTSNPTSACWQLTTGDNKTHMTQRLVLASGAAIAALPQTTCLPIVPARGQLSRFALPPGETPPKYIINGKHYLIPHHGTVLVGATFDRHNVDTHISQEDHQLNLAGLRELLPSLRVHPKALAGYAGVRATTPDRLPIVGPVPDWSALSIAYAELRHGRRHEVLPPLPCQQGLFVLGGLGSRGIVTAPLSAHLLAEMLMPTIDVNTSAEPMPDWYPLLNPARFNIRALKRGKTPCD